MRNGVARFPRSNLQRCLDDCVASKLYLASKCDDINSPWPLVSEVQLGLQLQRFALNCEVNFCASDFLYFTWRNINSVFTYTYSTSRCRLLAGRERCHDAAQGQRSQDYFRPNYDHSKNSWYSGGSEAWFPSDVHRENWEEETKRPERSEQKEFKLVGVMLSNAF